MRALFKRQNYLVFFLCCLGTLSLSGFALGFATTDDLGDIFDKSGKIVGEYLYIDIREISLNEENGNTILNIKFWGRYETRPARFTFFFYAYLLSDTSNDTFIYGMDYGGPRIGKLLSIGNLDKFSQIDFETSGGYTKNTEFSIEDHKNLVIKDKSDYFPESLEEIIVVSIIVDYSTEGIENFCPCDKDFESYCNFSVNEAFFDVCPNSEIENLGDLGVFGEEFDSTVYNLSESEIKRRMDSLFWLLFVGVYLFVMALAVYQKRRKRE